MEIVTYTSAMARDLTSLYNATIEDVPHCYPVSTEEFASAVKAGSCGGSSGKHVHSERAFVAVLGEGVLGFIHVGVGRGMEGTDPDRGVIRFFCYQRGHREAGQALLDAAEEYLRTCGMSRAEAFQCEYRYPFYQLHWSCLSDRLDHVHGMLGWNGYAVLKGEVFMDWRDYRAVVERPPPAGVQIILDWQPGQAARKSLTVTAMQGQKDLGHCACPSEGEYSRHVDAQDVAFVRGLNVIDAEQGKGLGRHLLMRALAEMKDAGYRHAVISTATNNYRAMLFYANHGFSAVDWTYAYGKDLA